MSNNYCICIFLYNYLVKIKKFFFICKISTHVMIFSSFNIGLNISSIVQTANHSGFLNFENVTKNKTKLCFAKIESVVTFFFNFFLTLKKICTRLIGEQSI